MPIMKSFFAIFMALFTISMLLAPVQVFAENGSGVDVDRLSDIDYYKGLLRIRLGRIGKSPLLKDIIDAKTTVGKSKDPAELKEAFQKLQSAKIGYLQARKDDKKLRKLDRATRSRGYPTILNEIKDAMSGAAEKIEAYDPESGIRYDQDAPVLADSSAEIQALESKLEELQQKQQNCISSGSTAGSTAAASTAAGTDTRQLASPTPPGGVPTVVEEDADTSNSGGSISIQNPGTEGDN